MRILDRKPRSNGVFISVNFILLSLFIVLLSNFSMADLTSLTVQGKLTDSSGDVLSGTYSLTFKLYDVTTSGTALFTQVSSITTDARGVYTVELVDIDLDFDVPYYLGVEVGSDGEMTPRYNLTSSPYSFSATGLNESIILNNNVSFDSNTLFIDTTNNRVGIATGSPGYTLDVVGGIRATTYSRFDNIVRIDEIYLASDLSILNKTSDGWNAVMVRNTSGTDAVLDLKNIGTIYTSGNVGIGTNYPNATLEVIGTINATGDICTVGGNCLSTAGAGSMSDFTLAGDSGSDTISDGETLTVSGSSTIDTVVSTGNVSISVQDDSIDGAQLADSITLDANLNIDSNTLYIDSSANEVGIGTNNPGSTLDVVGQFTVTSSSFPVGKFERTTTSTSGALTGATGVASGYLLKTTSTGDMGDGFGGGLIFTLNDDTQTADGNYVARIYARRDGADNEGALQFWAGTAGAEIPMTIRASGNVGIGTTAPSETLEISDGTKGLTVDPTVSSPTINTTGTTNVTITSSGGSVIIQLG